MKKTFITLLGAILFLDYSCTLNEPSESFPLVEDQDMIFTALLETQETKTILQNEKSVFWMPGDAISMFDGSGAGGGSRFESTNTNIAAITEFHGTLSGSSSGSDSYWGIYPYSLDNACDGSSVTLRVLDAQTAAEGTFANGMFPSIAHSKSRDLAFYNVCGGVRFSVSRSDITSVTLRANGGVAIAGTVKVSFGSDGKPTITTIINGKSAITIAAPDGAAFIPGVTYYIVMLPTELSTGITMTFITQGGEIGSFSSTRIQKVKRSTFGGLPNVDAHVTNWEGETTPIEGGGTESGLYLGVVGFNQMLYNCPITKLDYTTKDIFDSFINGLSTKNGTLLYYSVDKALKTLQHAEYPTDLFSASLVTFTDGLDQGSAMMIDNYPGDEEYLEVLHNRLKYSKVAGFPFTSYSVGLKGSDVSNEELFINNLQNLAIPSTNAYNVTSMTEVNDRLEDMAEWIIQRGFSYDLKITIPGTTNGTKVRFTLDDVNSADESIMYIEGTFNLPKRSFDNVSYVGLSSSSGSTVAGVQDGIFVTFNFKELLFESAPFGQSYIKQWNYATTGGWKENSSELATNLTRDRSAVVLFNLDCSSSLSGQFSDLQKYARSFVANLCDAVGSAITLDKTEISLITGKSETLTATVRPNNVNSNCIEWTSSNTSVATVDNGIVTGVGEGTSIITASYKHSWLGGRYILELNAQCIVHVGNSVKSIVLDNNSLTIYVADSPVTLVATVLPEDAFNKSVSWSSSNQSIATVSAEGQVTAVSNGNATITATAQDGGGANASCSVTVRTHVESVSLSKTEISLIKGNSSTLTATVLPSNASDKNVVWKSGNTSIATVDENGKVTAMNGGSTLITVTTNDGGKTASCPVTVTIPVSGVTLNKTSLVLKEGESETLVATISPGDASNKSVTWKSRYTDVATVNESGEVTAVSWGRTTITVKTNDGGKSAECAVIVPHYGNHEYVDLGLSVKWATCNVGATKQEGKGDYFAWGEIATKSSYEESNYKWHNTEGKYTKYCLSNYSYLWGGTGNPDNITVLNLADDVAHSKWYGTWRMPTYDEWKELIDNCSWVYTTINGVKGEKVTSKMPGFTNKWIFLPAAGRRYVDLLYDSTIGYYWSSSLSTDSPSYAASCIKFDSDGIEMDKGIRRIGLSVRPVSE